jgi:hypothetical protein
MLLTTSGGTSAEMLSGATGIFALDTSPSAHYRNRWDGK